MTRPIHVAILGASGYGAGELLRLLTQHPHVEVVSVTSTSQVGEPVGRVHPHLRGFYRASAAPDASGDPCELSVSADVDFDRLLAAPQAVVFSGLPSGASAAAIDGVLGRAGGKAKIIDLSGDLRLADERLHAGHYPDTPAFGERRREFVYGLAELNRDAIRSARFIANPGCLASASILAAAPLVADGFSGSLAIDAKTGSSGSGRALKDTTHHPTRHADFRAYKPLSHQHEPEILQALGDPRGERISLSFVAQSMDTTRGIFVTVHATLARPADPRELRARFADFYRDAPFVRIVEGSPTLQDVVGSNFCDVGVAARGRQAVVMASLDNLVKGMAGAAIQNMNLMCGLDETTGLWTPSVRPI